MTSCTTFALHAPHRSYATLGSSHDDSQAQNDNDGSRGGPDSESRHHKPGGNEIKKQNRSGRGRVVRDDKDHPTSVIYSSRTFKVVRVDPNGDCLYRCCADFLADGSDVQSLRDLIGQSTLLTEEERQAARLPGVYAGDRELAALAHAAKIAIVTHEGTYHDVSVAPRSSVGAPTRGTMHVLHLYNPEEEQGHYDLLV